MTTIIVREIDTVKILCSQNIPCIMRVYGFSYYVRPSCAHTVHTLHMYVLFGVLYIYT